MTALAWKIDDLENRSRRSNLRLLGLPEKSEGNDACTFLENWLPEALDMEPLRKPLAIERAHRIGYMRKTAADAKSIPESDDCEVLGLQRQGARDASGQSKEGCAVPKSSNHVLSGPFC